MTNPSTSSLDAFLWNYLCKHRRPHKEVTSETYDILTYCYRSGLDIPSWLTPSYVKYPRFSLLPQKDFIEVVMQSMDQRGHALYFVVESLAGNWSYRRPHRATMFFASASDATMFRLKFG